MAKKEIKENSGMEAILNKLLEDTEKRFGKGAIMNLEEGAKGIEFISSGSIALDVALGGGYPKGRIIEVYGENSTGKTTLAIHAMVEAQKQGGLVGFCDAEHSFDLFYAKNLGLDTSKNKFLFSQPSSGEEGLEIVDAMVKSGIFSMVVVDSVAALTPKAELEGEMGEAKMGLHARLMSQALRKLAGSINKTHTVVVFINQTRDKIGALWGNPTTTTGGNALKFYASQRIETSRSGQTKDGEEIVANGCRCKVIKNKVAPPFRVAKFDIIFGKGIDKNQEIIDLAVEMEIIKKAGSWYSYGDVKLGQGTESVKSILRDNPELYEELEEKILKMVKQNI